MNKEIEEILEGIKVVIKHNGTLEFDVKELKILLSYIEQLENDYKEANESITWWTNRFSAVERDNKNLKNNRDKAIEFIEEIISSTKGMLNDYSYNKEHNKQLIELLKEDVEIYKNILNKLKGDSDG